MPCSCNALALPIAECRSSFRIKILAKPLTAQGGHVAVGNTGIERTILPRNLVYFSPLLGHQQWIL